MSRQSSPIARGLVGSSLILVCGILAIISAFASWWTISVSGTGTVSFLPGDSYSATSGGTSASQTYAAGSLGQVGALYEGLLAGLVVVVVFFFLAALIGLLISLRKITNPNRLSTPRNLLIVALIILLALVPLVPALQPTLFHNSDRAGCNELGGTKTPCNSFWGSLSADGVTASWGSDVGWYLAIAAIIIAIASIVIWVQFERQHRLDRSSIDSSSAGPTDDSAGPEPRGDLLDRIDKAKALADSGFITQSEFSETKTKLIAEATSASVPVTHPLNRPLEEELRRLKSMHYNGTLTDSEYEILRKRAIQLI